MLDEQLQLLGIQRTPTLDYATHFRVYQSFDDGEEISIPEQAVDVVYVKVDHAKDDEEFDVSTDKDVNGSDTDYDPLLPVPNGSPFGEVDVYPAIKIPETVPWGTPPPNNKDTYIPPAMQLDPWMVMGRFVETTSTWGEDLFKHMERGSNGLFTSVGCRGFVRGYVQNESTPLRVVRKEHKPELSAYLYRLGVGVEYAQQIGSILMRAADVVGARVATFDEIRRTNEYAVALVTLSGRLVVIERNVPKQQV
jgi:ribosomal protein S18 acetylase RimI-like enzyme